MTTVNLLTKLSIATAGAAVIALGVSLQAAQATTLFNDQTLFQNSLSNFIIDDYESLGYQNGDISNSSSLNIHTNASMNDVFGETRYTTTTNFGVNGYNLIFERTTGNHIYCAGCNGSFLLDFTQTALGNALGVFGAGFNILDPTDYYAYVTFGDNSTENFSLAGQNFWGITSDKSIKTLHVGLENGLSTQSGYITIDNLTIGAKSVPEPASLIGILGLGAFGVTSLRKRKQAIAVKA